MSEADARVALIDAIDSAQPTPHTNAPPMTLTPSTWLAAKPPNTAWLSP